MRELKIDRLSDSYGQYEIHLKCRCGHTRRCYPKTLAAIAGWDAKFLDVVKRLRCSKCDQKTCDARVVPQQKPRGLRDER